MKYTGRNGGPRRGSGHPVVNEPNTAIVQVNSSDINDEGLNKEGVELVEKSEDGEFDGIEMPYYDDCLKAIERDGEPLGADKIFERMYKHIYKLGCKNIVPIDLIENYALHRSRFLKCEKKLSELGYIASHPTTHAPIATPFASLLNLFDKSQNDALYQINSIIKAHNPNGFISYKDSDYIMEQILST